MYHILTYMFSTSSIWKITAFALVLYIGIATLQQINLATADLGRHLKNGEIILSSPESRSALLHTNFYAATAGDHPFLNHHWLFGVIAGKLYDLGGFSLLSVVPSIALSVSVVLTMISALMIVHASSPRTKTNSWKIIVLTLVALTPLLIDRKEVRPEFISTLGVGLGLVTSSGWLYQNWSNRRKIWSAIVLAVWQLVWVNSHLFFILGLGIPLLIWGWWASHQWPLAATITRWRDWQQWWGVVGRQAAEILGLIGLLIGVSLLNPHGLSGALAPLNIFTDYNYLVAENMPTLFMIGRSASQIYLYYALFVVAILILALITARSRSLLAAAISSFAIVLLAIMGLQVSRLYPFVALLLLPLLADTFARVGAQIQHFISHSRISSSIIASLQSLLFGGGILGMLTAGLLTPHPSVFGVGLLKESREITDFLASTALNAPVFNNYDVGGLTIWSLYPDLKPFVDNRPEAYPPEHFDLLRAAMLEDEVWLNLDSEHDFQTILFHIADNTDFGQAFMIARIADRNWVPVFGNATALVLVKNNEKNTPIIKTHELSRDIFSVYEATN
jgi:hypothetical protein